MYDVLGSICIFSFLVLTPTLLVVKFTTNKPAWWLILIMIIVLGWGLVVGTYLFYHLDIMDLISQGREDELPDDWANDGASGVFALFGGWFFSLVYFLPWLSIYILATIIRRLSRSRTAPSKGMRPDEAKLSHRRKV